MIINIPGHQFLELFLNGSLFIVVLVLVASIHKSNNMTILQTNVKDEE